MFPKNKKTANVQHVHAVVQIIFHRDRFKETPTEDLTIVKAVFFYSSHATFLTYSEEEYMTTMYILRTDDRPTDRPTSHFGKFRMAISPEMVHSVQFVFGSRVKV